MSYESNKWMKKYEVKEPDLDFIKRENAKLGNASFEPLRYKKNGNIWIQKKNGLANLFKKKKNSATLMFTGDVACFDKQFEEARTEDGFDFNFQFTEMKPVFKRADLVVANLETVVMTEAPYRSEKIVIEENFYCNTPLEFLDAIRKSGVDFITNANNHNIDLGAVGVGETIDNMERFGFIYTGSFKDDRKRYEIVDINGIKVAIVAFATDFNALECNMTEEGMKYLLQNYTEEKAADVIKQARGEGAEVVIACVHWGKENQTDIHWEQWVIGKQMAALGYDCIIGSHPHVLQEFRYIEHECRKMPVFFSMGNYVSHNFNNIKARSIIAVLKLRRTENGIDISCSYIPIGTVEQYKGRKFVVLPFKKDSRLKKNQKRLKKIAKEIGSKITIDDSYVKKDYKEDILKKPKSAVYPKPDLAKVTEFPVNYKDNHFTYDVYEDHVCLTSIRPEYRSISCTVPENVLGLPLNDSLDGIFENNDHLKKIKSIGIPYINKAFCKNCNTLEGFRMGQTTIEIREEAFEGCVNLYSIVMKRGLTTIKNRAFKDCKNLKSVKIPSNVVEIADDAFEGCRRAVFYCAKGTYGEKFALEHGFKVKELFIDQASATQKMHIEEIVSGNKLSEEEAEKLFNAIKKKTGITISDFIKYKIGCMPNEYWLDEIIRRAERCELNDGKNALMIQGILKMAKQYDIEYKEARAKYEDMLEKLGVTRKEFLMNKFFEVKEEDLETLVKKTIKEREVEEESNLKAAQEKKYKEEKFIERVMKESSWSRKKTVANMNRDRKKYGASYENYSIGRFWELSEEQKAAFFTVGESKKITEKYSKEMTWSRRLFYYKDAFYEKFEPYLGRKTISTVNISFDEFVEKFRDEKKLIYKPRTGLGGHGIEVFDINEPEDLKKAFDRVAELPFGVVDGFVVQHHEMQKYSDKSVNTLRIVTIRTNNPEKGIETGVTHFVYGGMRMGGAGSYVDNLHSGGMIAALDINEGIICSDASNHFNIIYKTHPATGQIIKGFKIPYFKESLDLIRRVNEEIDIEGYYGWDIAITEEGPIIIEVNNNPGSDALQTPYAPMHVGMKHIFRKFF